MTIHVSLLSGTSASLRVSRAADLFQWMCKALVLMGIWYDVYSPKLSRILLLYCFILLLSLFPLLIWSIHLHPPTFISHFSANFLWDFSLFHGHPKLCHPGLSLLASERPETCCRARLVRESGGVDHREGHPAVWGRDQSWRGWLWLGPKMFFFFFSELVRNMRYGYCYYHYDYFSLLGFCFIASSTVRLYWAIGATHEVFARVAWNQWFLPLKSIGRVFWGLNFILGMSFLLIKCQSNPPFCWLASHSWFGSPGDKILAQTLVINLVLHYILHNSAKNH